GPGALDHPHDITAGGAAHDRVVDYDHAAAFEHFAHRIELHLHAEMPNTLLGLDERAAHIMIADEPHLVGNARLLRIPERRAHPGVRHRDDDVALGRILAGELPAQLLAHGVDVAAPQHRVRPREVHVLEHALQPLAGRRHAVGA